jgi:hypothetical protein
MEELLQMLELEDLLPHQEPSIEKKTLFKHPLD